ncbi:uncharacterized protein [Gossypium hirsutum]|uniref:RNase H type-1 domain-containing protein n=1 Tax=Gossypium hirsutum TaxID=3635 RepID=A0ABM2ZT72_GOSHI|nr:uncharacterized protein LOC107949957 [Gossypium hirsutum]
MEEYESLRFNFPDEDLMCISEKEGKSSRDQPWKISFNGASKTLGHGIGAVLVSPEGDHYPIIARLNFFSLLIYQIRGDWEVRDSKLVKYYDLVAELVKEFKEVTFNSFPREENQLADALATLASMFKVNRGTEIMLLQMSIYEVFAHCFSIEEQSD